MPRTSAKFATKVVLCLIVLNSYFCIADEESKEEKQSSDNNPLADENERNARAIAKGIGKILGLNKELTEILEAGLVFAGRNTAHFVKAIAEGQPSKDKDKYEKIASEIGKNVGKEIADTRIIRPFLDPYRSIMPQLTSIVAVRLTEFFKKAAEYGNSNEEKSSEENGLTSFLNQMVMKATEL